MFDNKKRVYRFGGKTAEGDGHMRELLGGKGANLAEMSKLGMPVPAGFTITTECCAEYYSLGGGYTEELKRDVAEAMKATETIMGKKFGDPSDPLLVSCRSGARSSMPGMMDTILNIGLCSETIPGMIQKTGNPRFVYDAYRRLIMMYSDVVMEKAEGIEPEDGQGIRQQLDRMMMDLKEAKGYKSDTDITAEELKDLCEKFKAKVKDVLGVEFPDTAQDQLWGSIGGVFKSWNGKRAIAYRRIEKIPDDWGTAVNVQSMVFGNMGNTSATGVAFSRNPANGDNKFYGEWLINAQGEDVVAGIRTPNPLNEATKTEKNKDLESLECAMPEVYKELDGIRLALEKHFQDMQDIEFTIQEGHLWMLQCRIGKRTGLAALQMAMDMVEEKMIDEKTAVIAVTHDRYFLDNVAGWILELDRGEGIPWKGNYSSWLEQKTKRLALEEKTESKRRKTLERELEWVRMAPKARQAKQKARIGAYEKMAASDVKEKEANLEIYIPNGPHLGNKVIEFHNVSKAYGDKLLYENLNFVLPPAGIVGVIGPNGAGKTTLFRLIMGIDKPDSGEITIGETVKIAYVDQQHRSIDPDKTVYETIAGNSEWVRLGGRDINARAWVSRFNFSGADQEKLCGVLSGGERNRLHLALTLKDEGNVLLLDEPTNDVDVNTIRALEEGLENFAGCAVVVSHDRWFLDRIATHILAFEGDSQVYFFEGNYQEYEENKKRRLGNVDPKPFKYKKLME